MVSNREKNLMAYKESMYDFSGMNLKDRIEAFGIMRSIGGQLRAYKYSSGCFCIIIRMPSGDRFNIGVIGKFDINMIIPSGPDDKARTDMIFKKYKSAMHAYKIFGDVVYCTNNLLNTPEEVIKSFKGNSDYAFSNSRETRTSMVSNKSRLLSILTDNVLADLSES